MYIDFLFPFELIPQNSKIGLYGAGVVGKKYYEQCIRTHYCKIIYWVDKNWENIKYDVNSLDISSPGDMDISKIDYLVVAIENEMIKDEIKAYYLQFLPTNKIIWRSPTGGLHDVSKEYVLRYTRLQMDRLIGEQPATLINSPQIQNDDKLEKKVKIRFFYEGLYFWNCFKSVVLACENDSLFDVCVIGCSNDKYQASVQKDDAIRCGIQFKHCSEYVIEKDCPDVAVVGILMHTIRNKIRKNAKLVVGIYGGLIKSEKGGIESYWKDVYGHMGPMAPDYYIVDKLIYNQSIKKNIQKEKMILIGNPKFDDIYNSINKEVCYPAGWQKLDGKRVILWATDHNYLRGCVAFDEYIKDVIDYFNSNTEMGLIIRPHPMYFRELVKNGIWTTDDKMRFLDYISETENIVIDESNSYDCAYKRCDAIVTDTACGIICSALPLNVPMAAFVRSDGTSFYTEEEILGVMQLISNYDEMVDYFEQIKNGLDPHREERNRVMQDNINFFDGNNGIRIKDFIVGCCEEKVR